MLLWCNGVHAKGSSTCISEREVWLCSFPSLLKRTSLHLIRDHESMPSSVGDIWIHFYSSWSHA